MNEADRRAVIRGIPKTKTGHYIMDTASFVALASGIHGKRYDYSKANYKGWKTDLIIICPEHGEFMQAPYRHINRGAGCPKCRWAKRDKTCLQKYGVPNPLASPVCFNEASRSVAKRHRIQTFIKRYGVDNPSKLKAVQEKKEETCRKHYGVEYYAQSDESKKRYTKELIKSMVVKGVATREQNGWRRTSAVENEVYARLARKFGEQSVKREYIDLRYPFQCDFYVVPKDAFVEINFHWTHGGKRFDGGTSDLVKLKEWQEKAQTSDYYRLAIDVWTRRDVEKVKVAESNKIKYYTIYDRKELVKFYEDWGL